jgi:hypothetical protein
MPFVSKAQQRKFYSDPKLRKFAAEWSAATPDMAALPEHVGSAKGANERAVARGKKHPKAHTRKPQSAANAKGPIYQTSEQEGIAKRALRRA